MKHIINIFFALLFVSFPSQIMSQDNYKVVIGFQFDGAHSFENGLAQVQKGLSYGFIDYNGIEVTKIKYAYATDFADNGLAAVKSYGDFFWGYIDNTEKKVIENKFAKANKFEYNGLAIVSNKNENLYGFIDGNGVEVIKCQYNEVKPFSKGLAAISKGGKWGYIDQSGKEIIPIQFNDAESFSVNGLAAVKKDDKWGYINQNGNTVIDFQFLLSYDFSNGFAVVYNGNKFGYINSRGELIIDYIYENAYQYSKDGLAPVKKDKKWGYINQDGILVIGLLYDDAKQFNNGIAVVKKGNKWGYIDSDGNKLIGFEFDSALNFDINGFAAVKKDDKWGYIKHQIPKIEILNYINSELIKWQEKGKFETTEAYKGRVTETNRKNKLEDFSNYAVQKIAPKYCDWKRIKADYDADNETFKITIEGLSPFYLKVPLNEAESFDKSINNLQFQNQIYALGNDGKFFLQKAIIKNPNNGKNYDFSSIDKAVFAYTQLNMNFEPIDINVQTKTNSSNVKTETKSVSIGLADVDINIPPNQQTNNKTFVVIIANENYSKEVMVEYANNDGKVFKEYCEKTLGIPTKNIHLIQDATFGAIKSELKWIVDVAQAYNGQAKLIFYYAGHGMPNEADKSAYLLPVDGISSDYETAIKLDELYNKLSQYPTQGVTVFLDACFSGSLRDIGMLANARGVRIKPKAEMLKGKMIVFTAATGDETAYPYKEKQHGLFTYFLLKKLQETKGNVDYQTLSNYITEQVKQQSIVVNQKSQTPQVITSPEIQGSWQGMKIK